MFSGAGAAEGHTLRLQVGDELRLLLQVPLIEHSARLPDPQEQGCPAVPNRGREGGEDELSTPAPSPRPFIALLWCQCV